MMNLAFVDKNLLTREILGRITRAFDLSVAGDMTATSRFLLFTALTPAILIAAGCAAMGPGSPGDALAPPPAVWTAPVQAAPEADALDWLAAFDDPALPGLAAEALARNNDFRAAGARLEQARASAVIAGAARLPTLDASGTVSGRNTDNPAGGRLTADSYALGLNASWEADVWGRVAAGANASEADALASEADLAGARLSLAGSTAQAWFALIEAELQEALAARDVGNRENSLAFIERRYASGVNTSLDVRLSRSALASARATLTTRRQVLAEASRQLEVLLGRYPAAELAAARDLPDITPLSGVGAPADLLWRRPDLVAADLRLEAAGLRADAARAAMLPRLTLQAGLTSNVGETLGTDLGDIFDPEQIVGSLIGGLAAPIFRGGALAADADRARAAAEERLAAYAGAALTAWREAENALAAEQRLADRAEQLRISFEEASRAEELTERQYNQGLVTIFNLLDAQGRRISSESQYIAARRERAANRVRLYLAIGGDFSTPPFAQPGLASATVQESAS